MPAEEMHAMIKAGGLLHTRTHYDGLQQQAAIDRAKTVF